MSKGKRRVCYGGSDWTIKFWYPQISDLRAFSHSAIQRLPIRVLVFCVKPCSRTSASLFT